MQIPICGSWNRDYWKVIQSLSPDNGITGCWHLEIKFIWCCSQVSRSYIDEIFSDKVTKSEKYFMLIMRSKISRRYTTEMSFHWQSSIGSSNMADFWSDPIWRARLVKYSETGEPWCVKIFVYLSLNGPVWNDPYDFETRSYQCMNMHKFC